MHRLGRSTNQEVTAGVDWPALLLALVAIALSTGVLYLTVGVYGTVEGTYDSASYLSGAVHLLKGNGYSIKAYDIASDTLRFEPITHYPPITSLVYAFFLVLGVPLIAAPVWTALCCWPLFLGGIGVLTYRLSGSWWGAAVAVAIASLTNPFLQLFQLTLSEPIFLPMLVWCVALLVGLPLHERLPPVQTAAAVLLLALMMMTRYASVVLCGAFGLWWVWWRVQQGQARRLLWEVPLWSLAALPLAAWLVRNRLVSAAVVGTHTEASNHTLWDGISGVLNQGILLLLPALFPLKEEPQLRFADRFLGWRLDAASAEMLAQGMQLALQLAVVGIVLVLARRLWKAYRPDKRPLSIPPAPIGFMITTFLFLYIVVQPFVSFSPMDFRDSTTLFCLVQPLLVAVLVQIVRRQARTLLTVYIGINLLLVVVPVVTSGIPRIVSLVPPAVQDFTDLAEAYQYEDMGIPGWLIVDPLHMQFIPRHHPEVMAFLKQTDMADGAIISDAKHRFFFYAREQGYVPGGVFKIGHTPSGVEMWLEQGSCASRHKVFILLLTLPVQDGSLDTMMEQVEEKCPELERIILREDTVLYRLEAESAPTTTTTLAPPAPPPRLSR